MGDIIIIVHYKHICCRTLKIVGLQLMGFIGQLKNMGYYGTTGKIVHILNSVSCQCHDQLQLLLHLERPEIRHKL